MVANRMKLLIVDDDAHVRRLLTLYFRHAPFEIREAATGEEALALIQSEQFDVALLDLILPYYGGFRLCQRLKQRTGKTPYVVIMTGDDSEETRNTANECGANRFLAKPFSSEEIEALINDVTRAS